MNAFTPGSFACLLLVALPLAAADYSAEVTILQGERRPISPYIYGSNQEIEGVSFTARRQGGNRMTGYNWENNASNAGSDYLHHSDNFLTWIMGIPSADENVPGIVVTDFHEDNQARGIPYSLVTLPLAGHVARDKSGTVLEAQAAPSTRWAEVRHTKGSAGSLTPDTTDNVVYTDELLNFLVQRYGTAAGGRGIRGYSMDNEPALWPHTHARLHPAKPTAKEIVARNIEAARMVKRMDPSAEVFGLVAYGLSSYISFQDAADWPAEKQTGDYDWFIDYFLAEMKKAGESSGARLLDVLDVHMYTEHRGGGLRVSDPDEFSNLEANKARIQAPRSLYDPTFSENSWIGQYYPWTLPLLETLNRSIARHYPGTKLALTEYNFGGESHISGGLAQADTLGALGAAGVYFGSWWQLHDNPTYTGAAFNLYRNYNGAGGRFGDTSVKATSSDLSLISTYASIAGSDDSRIHLVLINKSYDDAGLVTLRLGSGRTYTHARVWGFDASSAALTERSPIPSVTQNQVTYRVPALTAVHLVFESDGTLPPANTARLINLSTRATVGSGERVLIAGFYVSGSGDKKLLIRGVGPKLTSLGVTGALSNPQIRLMRGQSEQLAANDDWEMAPNKGEVAAAVAASGLPFDPGSHDAALVTSVPAGAGYTVVVSGVGHSTGIALAEIYDLDPAGPARLSNLSSRGYVGRGAEVMIAGFVVAGEGSQPFLVRAAGPALASFNVPGLVADPHVQLTTSEGTLLAQNENWSDGAQGAEVVDMGSRVGAFTFAPGSKDAALISLRAAGGCTAIVSGSGNSVGVALVELYQAP